MYCITRIVCRARNTDSCPSELNHQICDVINSDKHEYNTKPNIYVYKIVWYSHSAHQNRCVEAIPQGSFFWPNAFEIRITKFNFIQTYEYTQSERSSVHSISGICGTFAKRRQQQNNVSLLCARFANHSILKRKPFAGVHFIRQSFFFVLFFIVCVCVRNFSFRVSIRFSCAIYTVLHIHTYCSHSDIIIKLCFFLLLLLLGLPE